MRAFLAEKNAIKRDEIAARQLHALKQHYSGKLRLFDVKEMFLQMKDHAWLASIASAAVPFICMLLIAALAIIWSVLGDRWSPCGDTNGHAAEDNGEPANDQSNA
jgi:hypothetical protein